MSDLTNFEERLSHLEKAMKSLNQKQKEADLVIVVFSNDMDRVIAALNIALGSLSMGNQVSLFFTFWGITLLRENKSQNKNKLFLQKLFGWMLPKGPDELSLSQKNFGGIGAHLMKKLMKHFKRPSVRDLLEMVQSSGARFYVCSTTMEIMGIKTEELVLPPSADYCGVAKFSEIMERVKTCLFI